MKLFTKHFARSFIPAWIVLLGYILFMPRWGSPPFSSLAPHQQILAASALPMFLWSMWRFVYGLNDAKPTPEERVLD